MFRGKRRAVLGSMVVLVTAFGCLSPTLPLPPPERPEVQGPDPETGEVTLRGSVPSRSEVMALNLRTGDIRGQLTEDDGLYEFTLPAAVGDEVTMYYRQGTTESQSIIFMIRDPNAQ